MTTWQDWVTEATMIDAPDGPVAGYDLGTPSGPVVTYLHGYPSSSLDVSPILDRIGDRVRIVALDFPGFGRSHRPAGHPYSIAACADATEAVWRSLGIVSTVLLAHDYGVSVCQELLARRAGGTLTPDVTGSVWTNGGIYPDLHRPTLGQQMLLADGGEAVAAAITQELFVDGIEVTWGQRVPFDRNEMAEIWASMDDGGSIPQMHALLHYIAERRQFADRWSAALESSEPPSWFVWGDLDPVSGAHMIARAEERCPHATVHRLADVGHWPTLEAPDEVSAAVLAATGA